MAQSYQSKKKKKIWEAEAFSKKQAEAVYTDGPRLLVCAFVFLLVSFATYSALRLKTDFDIVDPDDVEKLKEVLTSGAPWLVLCKMPDDALPEGFEANLKHLGVTRAAIVQCQKALPSGQTVASKYKLDMKNKPVAFLAVGGNRFQLDPKQVKSDEKLELSKFVRKTVAKRYSLTDLKDSTKLRASCAKSRCVVWGSGSSYFGPKKAVAYPRWHHYRVPANVAVGGKALEQGVAIVWTQGEDRFVLFSDDDSEKSVENVLNLVDTDPSFAASKARKLGFEWSTATRTKTAPPETSSRAHKGQQQQRASPPTPPPIPEEVASEEPLEDEHQDEDDVIDLDL